MTPIGAWETAVTDGECASDGKSYRAGDRIFVTTRWKKRYGGCCAWRVDAPPDTGTSAAPAGLTVDADTAARIQDLAPEPSVHPLFEVPKETRR